MHDLHLMHAHLMPVSEYARHVGVSEATVRRWARRGTVPAVKVGPSRWRIDPEGAFPVVPFRRARRLTTNYAGEQA